MNQLEKPTHLTKLFIANIAETLGQKEGYFQITEYHMKKQHYYSVKISDGFFRIKVIFLDKASKQIKKGAIKQYSILKGKIKNNGDKLLTAKDQFLVWDCFQPVGFTKDWKFGRANLNGNGQTSIIWPDMDSRRSSQDQGLTNFRSSEQFIQKCEQMFIKQSMIKTTKSVIEEVSENNSLVKSGADDTVSVNIGKMAPKRKMLLVTSQSFDSFDRKPSPQVQVKEEKTNQKEEEDESNQWEELDEQIKYMSDQKIKSSLKSSKSKSAKKRRHSSTKIRFKLEDLENESDEDSLEEAFSLSLRQLKNSYAPKGLSSQFQIRMTDLVPSQRYGQNHWVYAKMITMKDLDDKLLCLLKGRQQTIVNLYLKKVGKSNELLLQNKIYQIKLQNIKIYEAKNPMYHTEIELHCDLQKLHLDFIYDKPVRPSNFSYIPLPKISVLRQNLHIHVFGLIKSRFYIPLKNDSRKWLNKYMIVDVVSGCSIEVVYFSDKKEEQGQVDEPMLGFNLSISICQNKKSLIVTKTTILLFGFDRIVKVGEQTPNVEETRKWIDKGNSAADLIQNIGDYQIVQRISHANRHMADKAYCIEGCYLTSFGANCKFESCDKCFKKTTNNWCRQCGQKRQRTITRLYMVATIGDCSGSLTILWQDNDCKRLIGQKGEGYEQFKERWLLESVRIWVRNDGKSEMLIVSGIERLEEGRNEGRIGRLREKLWYI